MNHSIQEAMRLAGNVLPLHGLDTLSLEVNVATLEHPHSLAWRP